MDLITFISENLLIVVGGTYVMGIFLKQAPQIKDKYIPLLLMGFAITFSVVIAGFNAQSILQGVLCWGVSSGIHQTAKQLIKGE